VPGCSVAKSGVLNSHRNEAPFSPDFAALHPGVTGIYGFFINPVCFYQDIYNELSYKEFPAMAQTDRQCGAK